MGHRPEATLFFGVVLDAESADTEDEWYSDSDKKEKMLEEFDVAEIDNGDGVDEDKITIGIKSSMVKADWEDAEIIGHTNAIHHNSAEWREESVKKLQQFCDDFGLKVKLSGNCFWMVAAYYPA